MTRKERKHTLLTAFYMYLHIAENARNKKKSGNKPRLHIFNLLKVYPTHK
jgi:hypothetical protein